MAHSGRTARGVVMGEEGAAWQAQDVDASPGAAVVIAIRSSWIIEHGWARPLGSPRTHTEKYKSIPLHVAVRHKIKYADTGLEIAKAEIARRIREKQERR